MFSHKVCVFFFLLVRRCVLNKPHPESRENFVLCVSSLFSLLCTINTEFTAVTLIVYIPLSGFYWRGSHESDKPIIFSHTSLLPTSHIQGLWFGRSLIRWEITGCGLQWCSLKKITNLYFILLSHFVEVRITISGSTIWVRIIRMDITMVYLKFMGFRALCIGWVCNHSMSSTRARMSLIRIATVLFRRLYISRGKYWWN